MLFDERGQADTYERKTEVAARAYKLLTEAGFPAEDIIFDPNVLAVATGIAEHDSYAKAFIDATRWIKHNLPHAKVSGGVSNLSFAFRGNNAVREAMHSAFLYHAIRAGMDMGIVNPQMVQVYSEIEPELLERVEDVILCRRAGRCRAAHRICPASAHGCPDAAPGSRRMARGDARRAHRPRNAQRRGGFHRAGCAGGLRNPGQPDGRDRHAADARHGACRHALRRGQDVPAAGREDRPRDEARRGGAYALHRAGGGRGANRAGKVLIATVKGDVHDIGKNIVAVVMACNGYEIKDLGVMVESQRIVDEAVAWGADCICLSGLITPSLDEMAHVCEELERRALRIPVIIGGATTSDLHTAVKIAPVYAGVVVHSRNASRNSQILAQLLGSDGALYADKVRSRTAGHARANTRTPSARAT